MMGHPNIHQEGAAPAGSRAPRAFTLVELIVAIGLVSLLAGVILSVGASLSESASIRRTRSTLQILHTAVDEWRNLARRELTWWQIGDPPEHRDVTDVHADTVEVLIISEILNRIERPSRIRDMLARVPDDLLYRYRDGHYPDWIDTPAERSQQDARFDGALTVLDDWGTPIYAIHPGRSISAHDYYLQRDPDGTIRTYNEDKYGVAPNRMIVFVSAGPDRRFGLDEEFADLFGSEREAAKHKARQDNIYSIPVEIPEIKNPPPPPGG